MAYKNKIMLPSKKPRGNFFFILKIVSTFSSSGGCFHISIYYASVSTSCFIDYAFYDLQPYLRPSDRRGFSSLTNTHPPLLFPSSFLYWSRLSK